MEFLNYFQWNYNKKVIFSKSQGKKKQEKRRKTKKKRANYMVNKNQEMTKKIIFAQNVKSRV